MSPVAPTVAIPDQQGLPPTDRPPPNHPPNHPLTLRQTLCINNAMPGGWDWIKAPRCHRPSGENPNVWRKTNCSLHLQRAILLLQRLPKIAYATGSPLKNLYVSSPYPSISLTRGYSFFFPRRSLGIFLAKTDRSGCLGRINIKWAELSWGNGGGVGGVETVGMAILRWWAWRRR